MTGGLRRIYPREWDRFAAAVPAHLRDRPLVDAYATMLADPDPAVREHAALEWCRWDNAQMGRATLPARFEDPAFRLRFARLVTHYWRNAAFLEDGQLLRDAVKLDGIPGALIQGRADVSCPLDTAYDLAARWTTARLEIVDAGHGGGNFTTAVTDALDRLAAERR